MCRVQRQNGDCHWWSHTLQLGSLSTSHICNAKLAAWGEKRSGEGNSEGERKCGTKDSDRSRCMCGNVQRVCVRAFHRLHVNSTSVWLYLNWSPLSLHKGQQFVNVWHHLSFADSSSAGWERTADKQPFQEPNKGDGAELLKHIHYAPWLTVKLVWSSRKKDVWEVKAPAANSEIRFFYFRRTLALRRLEKSKTIAVRWPQSESNLCFMHVFCNPLQSTEPSNCQGLEINSGTSWGVSSHLLTAVSQTVATSIPILSQ